MFNPFLFLKIFLTSLFVSLFLYVILLLLYIIYYLTNIFVASSSDVRVTLLDCDSIIIEFKLQSLYRVHFRTK